jgi:hypothetical protein
LFLYTRPAQHAPRKPHAEPEKIFFGPQAIASPVPKPLKNYLSKLVKYDEICLFFKQVQMKLRFFL